jgi:transcription regulator MmyB-like protein
MVAFRDPIRPVNTARFTFLDPRARTFYPVLETTMRDSVAALDGEAERNPYDRALSDLIGLLSTRSEEFRVEWARHDLRFHRSGTKRMRHPLVGDLRLAYERLELAAGAGLAIVTYSAESVSTLEAEQGATVCQPRSSCSRSRRKRAECVARNPPPGTASGRGSQVASDGQWQKR